MRSECIYFQKHEYFFSSDVESIFIIHIDPHMIFSRGLQAYTSPLDHMMFSLILSCNCKIMNEPHTIFADSPNSHLRLDMNIL